jgi:hypothetical protein
MAGSRQPTAGGGRIYKNDDESDVHLPQRKKKSTHSLYLILN